MLTSARSTALPCETVRKSTAMSASGTPADCCSRMHCTTAASSSLSVLHSTICTQDTQLIKMLHAARPLAGRA